MNVLFIAPRFPYPAYKGDQLTVYRRLEQVSKKHVVTLLTFTDGKHVSEIEHLEKYARGGIYCVKFSLVSAILHVMLKAPFSDRPFQYLLYESNSFRKKLKQILSEKHFDLIHFFLERMDSYRDVVVGTPCIMDVVDSLALNIQRRATMEHGIMRYICKMETKRLARYEKKLGQRYKRLIAVSPIDGKFFSDSQMTYIPSTVDVNKFQRNTNKVDNNHVFVFSGIMSYAPNIHAIKWFMRNVYPLLRQENIHFVFRIIGKNPTPEIRQLVADKQNVEITGYVESMNDALNQAQFAIAPMQSGSGMQGKIIEAMACGLPVVTTTLGKGAINAKQNEGLYVADTPQKFADTIKALLSHGGKCVEIGTRARSYIEMHHSNDATFAVLDKLYDEVLQE